jgi:hypothetical protein
LCFSLSIVECCKHQVALRLQHLESLDGHPPDFSRILLSSETRLQE